VRRCGAEGDGGRAAGGSAQDKAVGEVGSIILGATFVLLFGGA
jgi:hypothetical protein